LATTRVPDHLEPVVRPFLEGGKLFRALLALVSGSAVGGVQEHVVPAAQAVELVHAASLVHDDIIDGSPRRRGRPALHVELGVPAAIVVGDLLVLQAFRTLAVAYDDDSSGMRAVDLLSRLSGLCCVGELRELAVTRRRASEKEYLAIVEEKTASHFVAAVVVGATVGGASAAALATLEDFARHLGIAYQVGDDLADDEPEVAGSEAWRGRLRRLRAEHIALALHALEGLNGCSGVGELALLAQQAGEIQSGEGRDANASDTRMAL
jgi:geranylgeranyl pyrophosphate synthase